MLIKKRIIPFIILALFCFGVVLAAPTTGSCITIQEERELSEEFMAVVEARFPLIKDPVIVEYVNKVGRRILAAVPPQPFEYQFHVLKEDTYNAFATPAGHIFFNSGLFAALESEEELAGIIGHEIAHVVCRHISDRIENQKKISMATLAGMVAGVLLGAGGAAEAASGSWRRECTRKRRAKRGGLLTRWRTCRMLCLREGCPLDEPISRLHKQRRSHIRRNCST